MAHPIEGLMNTAMENIKEMVDVNTIVGDAVEAPDGTVIIPISRVSFGFAAGGGEYGRSASGANRDEYEHEQGRFPFAGGSGAGVSINPVAFMVVGQEQIKLLPVNMNTSIERIIDVIPDIIKRTEESIKKRMRVRKEFRRRDGKEEDSI